MTVYSCDLCGRESTSWAVIMRCEADCYDEAMAARRPPHHIIHPATQWDDE